jgi:large subunit ribosomal protein L10
MAVTKAKKAEQIQKLNSDLQKASSMIVGSFSKLTVAKDFELRKTVRGAGGRYQVVKNTLASRAGAGTQVGDALKGLKGVSSIAYTEGDPVALAKALSKYVEDNPEFTFKTGVLEGRVISVKEIAALATMPAKEEIYAKLLFLIQAPAQRLVTVLNATGRDLAVVINQGVEKKKFGGSAEAAQPAEAKQPEGAGQSGEAKPAAADAADATSVNPQITD